MRLLDRLCWQNILPIVISLMQVMIVTVNCLEQYYERQQQERPMWLADNKFVRKHQQQQPFLDEPIAADDRLYYPAPRHYYGPYNQHQNSYVQDENPYSSQDMHQYMRKKKNKARMLLINGAVLLGASSLALKHLAITSAASIIHAMKTTTTTTTEAPITTTTASTTSTSTSSTTSTTVPTTTTTPTTTPTTPTTTPTPVACDQTTAVTASTIGEMGTFATPAKVTGNQKFCQSVTAPPGTKLTVVCTIVSLTGGSKIFEIFDSSDASGAKLATPQPAVGQTYTTTSNAVYFEAFISASDDYSCKWTVVAVFLRSKNITKPPSSASAVPPCITDADGNGLFTYIVNAIYSYVAAISQS